MARACACCVRAKTLERDPALHGQMRDCSSRIPAHIGEGFGQKTDRHFAHYLYIARGSCNEARTHLTVAKGRHYITSSEWKECCERYVRIGKMLTNLLKHLGRENRLQRG